jgi:inosose dehydratase
LLGRRRHQESQLAALAAGVRRSGRGVIDYPAIRDVLTRIDYQGFITVEQERDPSNAGGSLADVKASREYLRSVGF